MNITGNAVWHLIKQSDKMTWLILLSLFFLSVFCWTILFYKLLIWKTKKRQIKEALFQLKHARKMDDIIRIGSEYSHTIIGYYITKNLSYLRGFLEDKKNGSQELNDREWNMLQNIKDSAIDDIIWKEESYLPVLSVAATISTLIGLFGTVWGLIHAFIDISKKQSADIATVAPGIAEALIATLAGLLVAIPAFIMYYYLKLKLVEIEQSMVSFADKFSSLMQKLLNSNTEQYNFNTVNTQATKKMELDNA